MKILLLSNKAPWPPKEGGPMATHALVTGLIAAGHQVKILALNTNKLRTNIQDVPQEFRFATGLELIDIDISLNPVSALYNLLTGTSYHVSRFDNDVFRKRLAEILQHEDFDVVQYEIVHMAVYHDTVKKFSSAKTVIRAHNIEHLIWQRVALSEKNFLKRWYMKKLFLSFRQFELNAVQQVNGIAAITETDAEFFRKQTVKARVISVPYGIDPSELKPVQEISLPLTFFTLGSMNWVPNIEGVEWLCKKVWPLVIQKNPDLKLFIAGRHMPDYFRSYENNSIRIVGEVPDSREFINAHAVMLVPLFAGSGIRIKIIEGMSAGRGIISTTIGAEGIEYSDDNNILIADDEKTFAGKILLLANNLERVKLLGKNARKLIEDHYDNQQIISKLVDLYEGI